MLCLSCLRGDVATGDVDWVALYGAKIEVDTLL